MLEEYKREQIIKVENRRFQYSLSKFIALISLVLGIGILILFFLYLAPHYSVSDQGNSPDMAATGQIGDFVGGIVGALFSLSGVVLLYMTLNKQTSSSERERLETRFFQMVQIHRDNVQALTYTVYRRDVKEGKSKKNKLPSIAISIEKGGVLNCSTTDLENEENGAAKHVVSQRKVFRVIFEDFEHLFSECKIFFDGASIKQIYDESYLSKLQSNSILAERKICLMEYARIDIVYSILFFGAGKDAIGILENIFKGRYDIDFCKKIIENAALKPKQESRHWSIWKSARPETNKYILLQKKNFEKYYGRHQFRLGHYFRHLYQSVDYINNSILLDYHEKYQNVKFLRAQLSTYEQYMLFLNSISYLGRVWELEKKDNPSILIDINSQLITKYNLIKNLPKDEITAAVKVTSYYPMIDFENSFGRNITEQRIKLVEQYR